MTLQEAPGSLGPGEEAYEEQLHLPLEEVEANFEAPIAVADCLPRLGREHRGKVHAQELNKDVRVAQHYFCFLLGVGGVIYIFFLLQYFVIIICCFCFVLCFFLFDVSFI